MNLAECFKLLEMVYLSIYAKSRELSQLILLNNQLHEWRQSFKIFFAFIKSHNHRSIGGCKGNISTQQLNVINFADP